MAEKLWIGIDGGGTKTTAVIGDEHGNLLAVVKGGSGNLTAISSEQLSLRLQDLIDQLLMKTNRALCDVKTIFAAMAGADRQGEQEKIYKAFQQSPIYSKLTVQSDIHAALASGTWGREGTLIIAGTGSILFGYQQQKMFRIGGWGYLLGDEGSGYQLGKLAIRSILKANDEQIELSTFQKAILTHFNAQTPNELITNVYSSANVVTAISSVSRLVVNACKEDSTAKLIVQTIIDELLNLLEVASTRLDRTKPVVLHGGLFSNDYFLNEFKINVSVRFPELLIIKPTVSAAVGAYLLALQEDGMVVDDLVKQTIEKTWHLLEGEGN